LLERGRVERTLVVLPTRLGCFYGVTITLRASRASIAAYPAAMSLFPTVRSKTFPGLIVPLSTCVTSR
ncbi:MAG: hypothetical protein ABWY54_06820, partial [Glaciihabitans sp.]